MSEAETTRAQAREPGAAASTAPAPAPDVPRGRTRIKCCGMFRDQDIMAVNEARPDFCGFIVDFPKSHRSVSPEHAAELAARLAPGILPVGVFVDEDPAVIVRLIREGAIGAVQLHGHEDEGYIGQLRTMLPKGTPVVQAFRVRHAQDVARAEASSADLVLLDNGQGTGERFDWSLVKHVSRPFVLAGGLTPQNVADAIRQVHPWAVDLSSGLETDGLKDPYKIKAAVAAVREAE